MLRSTLLLGLVLPVAGLALCAAAAAQEQPRHIFPTRDVAITYTIIDQQKNNGSQVAMHWKAGGQEARVDLPGNTYAIVDRGTDRAMLVMPRQHIVMQIPLSGTPIPGYLPDRTAQFTRGGSDTVAGYRCSVWTLRNQQGTATVCLTEDGVVLRAHGQTNDGRSGGVLANSVSFETQPQGLFTPPPDFPKVNLPPLTGKLPVGPNGAPIPQ